MSESINILIVEDESIVAMDLAAGLEQDGYKVVGIADSFKEALQLFSENAVDIILMDINIQGDKDGVDTAAHLRRIRHVPLIYLTAFTDTETIERVKLTQPSAFLTKPYNIENVRIAIDLALHHFAELRDHNEGITPVVTMNTGAENSSKRSDKEQILQMNDQIFIRQNYRFTKMKLSELLFAEAENNYVHLHTVTQKFALRVSLGDLLEKMKWTKLVRVHRSFAVNINEISSFDDQLIKMGSHEIPIGRNYREEFMAYFNLR